MNRVRLVTLGLGFAALVAAASCGTGVEGTYGDAQSPVKIVLKSGGKATMSFMNESKDCTYTNDKKKISVDCKDGAPLDLTLSDDGTMLQMPAGSMMPNLKKQ
jgi:hypothetical protein